MTAIADRGEFADRDDEAAQPAARDERDRELGRGIARVGAFERGARRRDLRRDRRQHLRRVGERADGDRSGALATLRLILLYTFVYVIRQLYPSSHGNRRAN